MLKRLGGRKGGATRHGKGGSAVHKTGKKLSNREIRKSEQIFEIDDYCADHNPFEGLEITENG